MTNPPERGHTPVVRRFFGQQRPRGGAPSADGKQCTDRLLHHVLCPSRVQAAAVRAWKQAPEVSSMRAYLLQTTRNILIDMHRAAGRRVVEVAAGRDDDSRARVDPRAPSRSGPEVPGLQRRTLCAQSWTRWG